MDEEYECKVVDGNKLYVDGVLVAVFQPGCEDLALDVCWWLNGEPQEDEN